MGLCPMVCLCMQHEEASVVLACFLIWIQQEGTTKCMGRCPIVCLCMGIGRPCMLPYMDTAGRNNEMYGSVSYGVSMYTKRGGIGRPRFHKLERERGGRSR